MMPLSTPPFSVGDVVRVRAAVAPMLGEARISATVVSQQTAGHCVTLLERAQEWWRVRGDDAYEGWMHRGYLEPASGDEADWPVTTGAIVKRADGLVRAMPYGARVAPDSMVLEGNAYDEDDRRRAFPANANALARSAARHFVGASYLWGGITPWGVDCSGFVQAIAGMHGIRLPRDAWQQAGVGETVQSGALQRDAVVAGDLLFFSDREDQRITHVAMALGETRFVHSAVGRGGVTVEQLESPDEYLRKLVSQFVRAQRVAANE